MTIAIQIGNSDDRLTQAEWSEFVAAVQNAVETWVATIHFAGCSAGNKRWQNACWVFECGEADAASLKSEVKRIRERFRQESVAWTEGATQFV